MRAMYLPAGAGPFGVPETARALGVSARELKVLISAGELPAADVYGGQYYALWSFSREWLSGAVQTLRMDPGLLKRVRYGAKKVIVVQHPPGTIKVVPKSAPTSLAGENEAER